VSGLFSTLNSSIQALNAQSRGIEIAGKNLANVNNPNYARQRVLFGDRGTVITPNGAESMGLVALGVEQLRDSLLDRQVMREISSKTSSESEQAAYQRAQAGLGETIDRTQSAATTGAASNTGVAAALDDFFNAFQSLAASPTDDGERQSMLQKATILVDRVKLADQSVGQVQSDLNAEIGTDVDEVNNLLSSLATLNSEIVRVEITAPGSAVDLRDQRQARLEKLAAKIPVELRGTGNQVQVITKDASGTDVVLVNGANVQGAVNFDGTQLTGGSPAATLGLAGGSIQGALGARDGALQTLRNDLNSLARQLVTSVNGIYNPGGTSSDFFTATGTTAATVGLATGLTALNLKTGASGNAGDNSVVQALADLANHKFAVANGDNIDGTASGFFSQTVSRLGQALAGANARVEDQSNIEQLVRSQRDAVSGVSLDEEMGDLMKYQRAFQASSRVFNIVDDLLDTVVNRLGVG